MLNLVLKNDVMFISDQLCMGHSSSLLDPARNYFTVPLSTVPSNNKYDAFCIVNGE